MEGNSVSFTLDEADVVAASSIAIARRLPVRIEWLVGLALVAGGLGIWLSARSGNQLLESLAWAVLAAAMAVVLVHRLFVPWQARKHFRELAAARGPTTLSWNEEGTIITASKGESRLAWSDYHSWIESERYLLLFQSHIFYNLVPKRALDEAQLAALRELLDRAGVKRR